jgi:hypothetical protein
VATPPAPAPPEPASTSRPNPQPPVETIPVIETIPVVPVQTIVDPIQTFDEPAAPPTPGKYRKNTDIVHVNKNAKQHCGSDAFTINISKRTSAAAKIVLAPENQSSPKELYIGSLPDGIQIVFSKNDDYLYDPQTGETAIHLKITKEASSQKGSFSIPILYTEQGAVDSTMVCQINIINF